MVPNPIYDGDGEGDGPVYDSVRPQYETLVAIAPARFTETQQGSSVTELSHNNDADVVLCDLEMPELSQLSAFLFHLSRTLRSSENFYVRGLRNVYI